MGDQCLGPGNCHSSGRYVPPVSTPPFKTGSKPVMTLSQASLQFNWPIQTMDFNQLTYFLIVLIGVIVSRYYQISQQNQPNRSITKEDFLWAGIAAIIALLVFSNFQQQVTLTRHIITNLSLAFGFGFGFDKSTFKP